MRRLRLGVGGWMGPEEMLGQRGVHRDVDLAERGLIAGQVLGKGAQQQLGRERRHEHAGFDHGIGLSRQQVGEIDHDVCGRVGNARQVAVYRVESGWDLERG